MTTFDATTIAYKNGYLQARQDILKAVTQLLQSKEGTLTEDANAIVTELLEKVL